MQLKPQDLLVTLKLAVLGMESWRYAGLADSLGLGQGEAHAAVKRALYRSVPLAARNDSRLYEMLALVDAVRGGRSRERKMAMALLQDRTRSA